MFRSSGQGIRELRLDLLKLVGTANLCFSRKVYKYSPELVKRVCFFYIKSLEGLPSLLSLRGVRNNRNKVVDHLLSIIKGVFAIILVARH